MENTNTNPTPLQQEPVPSQVIVSQTPVEPAVATPVAPSSASGVPPVHNGEGGGGAKMLIVVVVVVIILGCALGAVVLYKQMHRTTEKKPSTNYVMDNTQLVTPTSAEPTVPAGLNEPVATDASGIAKEIKILEETANSSDSSNIRTEDIQNVTQ